MSDPPTRWRFSLLTLVLLVGLLSVFFAANLAPGRPREMYRFAEADGGATVNAYHRGWPVTFLRTPTGRFEGRMASDFAMPGLLIDLAFMALLSAAALLLPEWVQRFRSRRGRNLTGR